MKPASILLFYWKVLKKSFTRFAEVDVLTQSAALSYYTIFSLPPMLLIILRTAAQFYSEKEVKQAIFSEIGGLVGREGAMQLASTLEKLDIFEPNWWATAVSIAVLLFTSTTVFVTMQNALNQIFGVQAGELAGSGILKMLRDRAISFALLISIAFILLVSLTVDALVSAFSAYLANWIGELSAVLVILTSILLPLAIITLLFAMLFKFLPDAKLKWRDTWFGAIVTALLFVGGKHVIGLYIGNSETATLYDAAGSLLVVMLWAYYASAILLFGATFTYMRATLLHHELKPKDHAVKVEHRTIEMQRGSDVAAP